MKKVALCLALAGLGGNLHALADISYAQKIQIEAGGAMAMMASEGTVLTQLSGDRSRSESDIKMKSGLLQAMAGQGRTVDIVRLDKGLTWTLHPDKQEYSEITFEQLRAQVREAQQQMAEARGSGGGLPVSAEGCNWSEADIEVENTDERQKIAGIKTRKSVLRSRQTCTDRDSGKTCDVTLVMEAWLARKVPAQKEVNRFRQAYAEALGLGDAMEQVNGMGYALVGMFADNWEEVVDEFDKLKGYPLRTVMQMGMGGEQCTTASGEPIAMDDLWAEASTSAYNAALDQAGYEAGSAVGRGAAESLGGSIAGNIGGAAVGAAAGEIIGGLTSMFKKKKPEPQEEASSAPAATPGGQQVTVFRITSEVTNWSEISVPAERFEEPVGWTRK